MKDAALRIYLFMWILSGMLAAVDILIAGPLGIELVGMDGEPAGPRISAIYNDMATHDLTMHLVAIGEIEGNPIELGIRVPRVGAGHDRRDAQGLERRNGLGAAIAVRRPK